LRKVDKTIVLPIYY